MNNTHRLLAVALFACRSPATVVAEAGAPLLPLDASSSADGDAGVTPTAPAPVVAQWNDSHTARDASALGTIYAATVYFYGKNLPRAECVKRKAAAFAKARDYTQAVRDVVATQRGDRTVITLVKQATAAGKTTDFPSVLYVDQQGHISAEMDKPDDDNWCFDGKDPIPPFTIDAARAKAHLLHSRYLRTGLIGPNGTPDATMYRCPHATACPSGVTRSGPPLTEEEQTCFYKIRLGVDDPGFAVVGARTHQWLDMETWVDGVSDVHWYRDVLSDAADTWHHDP
jgi:hypothetical protein